MEESKRIIFISHIYEEEEIAQAIKEVLCEFLKDKADVFLSETIPFGEDWQKDVNLNLIKADLILTLFSPDSIDRPWINIEAGYGIISKKKVIPLYCLGLDENKLHYIYQRLKAVDIQNYTDIERLFEDNIQKVLLENEVIPDIKIHLTNWQEKVGKAVLSYLNQQIIKVRQQPQTYFHICNVYINDCLDVFNWSKVGKAKIIAYPVHGGNNQLWQLQRVDQLFFRITSKLSQMCLEADIKPSQDDSLIQQNEYKNSPNQQWELTLVSNSNYKISPRGFPNLCLSIAEINKGQVSKIELSQWGHKWEQQWLFKILATVTPL